MQARTLGHGATALAVSLLAAAALAADEPVPALQDLMGAKGASVETSLTGRGYAFLGRGEGAKKASATFAGMNPQDVDVTTTEGTTQFLFEGKPYFRVSDRRAAELELQSLR
jgi:hypothetical protein